MCSRYEENLGMKYVQNMQFQVFELPLHSEKEFELSVLYFKNSMLTGLFQDFSGKININI